jgi:hypothetical protein
MWGQEVLGSSRTEFYFWHDQFKFPLLRLVQSWPGVCLTTWLNHSRVLNAVKTLSNPDYAIIRLSKTKGSPKNKNLGHK